MKIIRNTENLSGTTERFFTVPAGIQCKILTSIPDESPPTDYVWVYLRAGQWRALDEHGTETSLGGGEPGIGIPTGGSEGQALIKASDTNYDTEWGDVATGTGGSPNLDGGRADSNYGAISPINGGSA